MRYHPNLDVTTQAILVTAFMLLAGLVMARISLFLSRQWAGVPSDYPSTWTVGNIQLFEKVRRSLGFALGITWAILLLLAPRMPQSWPFGLAPMGLTVALLLLTNAWLLLLMPSKWENGIIGRIGFSAAMGVMVWWWTTLVGTLLLAIVFAVQPEQRLLPLGAYVHYHQFIPALPFRPPTATARYEQIG